jgi:hypothetical protein
MQLYRFLDFWQAWHAGLWAKLLIAGAGMFLFLRSQDFDTGLSLAGSIIYAANSQFVIWMNYGSALSAFCFMPFVLWALTRARGGNSWPALLVPISLALCFLGSTLQQAVFVILAVSAAWFGLHRWPTLKSASLLAFWVALAFGLSAVMLVPCVDAYWANVHVGNIRGQIEYQHGWTQPILTAILYPFFFFPSLLGSVQTIDLAKLLKGDLFSIAHFGFLPTTSAMVMLVMFKACPRPAFWLMLAGLIIPLTPLEGPLYHRVLIVFVLGGTWAFCAFWKVSTSEQFFGVKRMFWKLFLGFSVAWLLISVILRMYEVPVIRIATELVRKVKVSGSVSQLPRLLENHYTARDGVQTADTVQPTNIRLLESRAARFCRQLYLWHPHHLVPWLLAFASVGLLRFQGKMGYNRATLILTLVFASELTVFASRWLTWMPRDLANYPASAELNQLAPLVQNGWAVVLRGNADRSFLPANLLSVYDIPSIEGYESILPAGMWWHAGFTSDPAVLGTMGVSHGITRTPAPNLPEGWTPVIRGQELTIFENRYARPKYLALASARWPSDHMSESPLPTVRVLSTTNNRRVLEIPGGARALRIAENWASGWTASISGGASVAVQRAEDYSMLLPFAVTDRTQIIELRYHSIDATAVSISLIAGGILLGYAGLIALTSNRRQ